MEFSEVCPSESGWYWLQPANDADDTIGFKSIGGLWQVPGDTCWSSTSHIAKNYRFGPRVERPSQSLSPAITEALSGKRGDDQQRIAETGLKWIETILAKNADYGSSVFDVPDLAPECDAGTAIRVRMSDKVRRIKQLLSREPEVVGESLDDSFRDLGAYCLLWLCRPRDEKGGAA